MSALDDLRAAAAEQATALGAEFIGSEHLFLAWLLQATGPAADELRRAGLTADAFREVIVTGAHQSRRGVPGAAPGTLSSQAQRVLAAATELASAAGRPEATLDDAGLAMIREPRGAVARALAQHQVKPSRVRSLLAPSTGDQSARQPVPDRAGRTVVPPAAPQPQRRSKPAAARRDPEVDDIPEARAPERPRLVPRPVPVAATPARVRQIPMTAPLLLAIPVSIWLRVTDGAPLLVFLSACLGVIPLAAIMGRATDQLADRSGATVGGLLNAGFGNAAELIIALAALRAGYIDLVQASITGSILSNLLFILGLSLFTGGMRAPILTFNRTTAGMSATMLALAVAALLFPGLAHAAHPGAAGADATLSMIVAAVLAATYLASLIFVFRTHRPLFASGAHDAADATVWPLAVAIAVLAAATAGVAVESQILVDTVGAVTQSLGMSQAFLGLIIIPIIGNAAEHATAIVAARRGKTDLALQIALGSSTQVALLVAPVLVLVGLITTRGMSLVFAPFQVTALAVGVLVSSIITLDGESHWLEGVQLLALYAMMAAAAWFI